MDGLVLDPGFKGPLCQKGFRFLGEFDKPDGQRPGQGHFGVVSRVTDLAQQAQALFQVDSVHKVGELHHSGKPGFVFLIARYIRPEVEFNDKLMKFGFWALNWGLALMVLISLLPIGLIQSWASVTQGLWLARSEDFMQQPLLQNLRWLRMVGDTIMILGALAFFWQIVKVTFTKKQ